MRAFVYKEKYDDKNGMAEALQVEIKNILDTDDTFNNEITKSYLNGKAKTQKESTQYINEKAKIEKALKEFINIEGASVKEF